MYVARYGDTDTRALGRIVHSAPLHVNGGQPEVVPPAARSLSSALIVAL